MGSEAPFKIPFKDKVLDIAEGNLKSLGMRDYTNLLFVLHPGKITLYQYKLVSRQLSC